jgi:hypothetical protein
MQGSLPSRIFHVAFHPDEEILKETIAAYSYTVPLESGGRIVRLDRGTVAGVARESLLIGTPALAFCDCSRLTIGVRRKNQIPRGRERK